MHCVSGRKDVVKLPLTFQPLPILGSASSGADLTTWLRGASGEIVSVGNGYGKVSPGSTTIQWAVLQGRDVLWEDKSVTQAAEITSVCQGPV